MPSPNEAPDDLARLPGTLVADKYRVERMIGRGGMGAVFSATNTAIGKRVALKFLAREAARDPAATQRFQREAQAAGVIESEHIVHVFDAGTSSDGLPFLVMELLVGEDLRACLRREEKLTLEQSSKIASEVLRALVRAHGAGIVHRDLKPDNVFLCRRDDGSVLVKLVDFGISKLVQPGGSERLTYRGTVLGSAHYIAPEQAEGRDDVDHRADLYGVGALLFEMLAGRPPHLGPSNEAVLVAICTEEAPDVRSFRPDTPEGVALAVARALSLAPGARFQSATEFLAALADPSGAEAGSSRSRKRTRTLVAGILAMLLGFTLTAVLVARRARPTPGADTPTQHGVVTTTAAAAVVVPEPASEPVRSATLTAEPLPKAPAPPPLVAPRGTTPAATPSPTPDRKRQAKVPRVDAGVAHSLELSTREP